jgi:hypothetical protein
MRGILAEVMAAIEEVVTCEIEVSEAARTTAWQDFRGPSGSTAAGRDGLRRLGSAD